MKLCLDNKLHWNYFKVQSRNPTTTLILFLASWHRFHTHGLSLASLCHSVRSILLFKIVTKIFNSNCSCNKIKDSSIDAHLGSSPLEHQCTRRLIPVWMCECHSLARWMLKPPQHLPALKKTGRTMTSSTMFHKFCSQRVPIERHWTQGPTILSWNETQTVTKKIREKKKLSQAHFEQWSQLW